MEIVKRFWRKSYMKYARLDPAKEKWFTTKTQHISGKEFLLVKRKTDKCAFFNSYEEALFAPATGKYKWIDK